MAKAKRRLRERRTIVLRLYVLLGFLGVLLLAALVVYGLWRPEVRINSVSISGTEVVQPQEVGRTTKEALTGRQFFVLPKNSTIFLKESAVEASLLETFLRLESAEISRTGLQSIEVAVSEREPVAMWCSGATSTPCMLSDEQGFLFAQAQEELLPVRGPLKNEAEPLGNIILREGALADVLSIANPLAELGVAAESIEFRAPDEVILYLVAGPRIEYVLGTEAMIAESLPTVLANIKDLETIEYIDMRFGTKVYIQRHE